ncbi:MAG: DUF4255 domain-containing protein [Kofleriaceae bacterium]
MASWPVIEHVSQTLKRIIKTHVDTMWPGSGVEVRVATPHLFTALRETNTATITIFLYRFVENGELRNSPMRRLPGGELQRAPMQLELCYLMTAWGARDRDPLTKDELASFEEHKLMGLVLQALYDKGELGRAELYDDPALTAPAWGAIESVQVLHETLPIEDLYRIWDSSELAYQLSAAYRVRIVGIDSTAVRAAPPVTEGTFAYDRKRE